MTTPLRCAFLGECMIELQGAPFGTMQQTMGGDTLNAAVYLAHCSSRQQLRVSYATALGTDHFSDIMLTRWQQEGIDIGLVDRLPDRLPGLYHIETDRRGERRFQFWRGDSAARHYFDRQPALLEAAAEQIDLLYLSGISLAILPDAARFRVLHLMQALAARGAWVVFDNNYRPRLWPDVATARHWFDEAVARATLGLITLDDHQALHALSDAASALVHAQAMPLAELVIKQGAQPTLLRSAERWQEVATEPVTQVIDTTAAGDSFAGAYLSRRLTGEPPGAAAAFANRVAARVIQHPGALIPRQAMPDLMRHGQAVSPT